MTWRRQKIGSFCETGSGGTPSRGKPEYYGGDIPWVKSGELKDDILLATTEAITDAAIGESSAKIVPTDAVLVAMYGATVGKTAILGIDAATNQAVCNIRPKPSVASSRYVWYALRHKVPLLLTKRVGGAQPNISQKIIRETSLPLPPPSEQRRIVEILDQADALRKKRAEADKIADRILPALFYKMFGDPATNPMGWDKVPFSEACESRLGKMLDAKQQTGEHRRPYLRNANVLWGRFDLSGMLEMDFNPKDRKEFALQSGDLLICEGGEVGRCAIWQGELPECYFQKALHRGRPIRGKATAEYLQQLLWELAKHGGLRDATSHATISHLTGVKLKRLLIPLPPNELQAEFALQADALTRSTRGRLKSGMKLQRLFETVLHRAFSGDLTAKWREAHMKELLQEMEQQARKLQNGVKA